MDLIIALFLVYIALAVLVGSDTAAELLGFLFKFAVTCLLLYFAMVIILI